MKKVLIIKGFIAASIIAVLGQLTSCQNEDGFTQKSYCIPCHDRFFWYNPTWRATMSQNFCPFSFSLLK